MKITFEDYKKIQELKRQGFNANQATKKLPYTQYKIYKYWDMAEEDFFEETNADNSPCSVYREFLMEEIRKNNNAGARILYDKVFEEFGEVKVSLASLFRYVKGLRRRMGLSEKIVRVKQAVEMQPQGLEAQVDFGQAKMLNMYGLPVKVYFFCMVLSYSRMKFVYFSPDPFDALHTAYAHEKAFKYYGGRPKQILYDQDRTIVSSENAGNIIFTKDFDGYVKAAGFDAIVCKPYSPDTKGKVETVVKTVKEYFLEGREYCGIDRLNSDCIAWLDRTGNNLAIQALRKSPRELFEREKGDLIKHKPIEIDIYRNRIAVVISPFIVRYKGNRYSVPPSRCNEGDKVRIEEEENALHIINLQTGEKIITHKLELQKGKSVVRREVSTVDYLKTAKRRYEHSDVMINFLERIEITKPRYLKEQAGLLRRIEKEYTQSEILNAVIKCSKDDRYCMTEVLSELLIHLGERNLEEIAPKGAITHYKNLAKYNVLTEVKRD
ncbi:MAG: transposase family protein [Clostridia bacterium]|nr:transposase family protein [Clostridia bacterium]